MIISHVCGVDEACRTAQARYTWKQVKNGRINTCFLSAIFLSLYHCTPFELLNNEEWPSVYNVNA